MNLPKNVTSYLNFTHDATLPEMDWELEEYIAIHHEHIDHDFAEKELHKFCCMISEVEDTQKEHISTQQFLPIAKDRRKSFRMTLLKRLF